MTRETDRHAIVDRTGFHETRIALYNLYPTLVHVGPFGASYLPRIENALRRLGH